VVVMTKGRVGSGCCAVSRLNPAVQVDRANFCPVTFLSLGLLSFLQR